MGDFYLANELVLEILSWVPVTSLLHCKLVCKSWLSIISSPVFNKMHLINSKKKQTSSLIQISEATPLTILNVDEPVRINLPRNLIGRTNSVRINLPRNFIGRTNSVRINLPRNLIGRTNSESFRSCNGLLFHHNMINPKSLHDNVSFIWNPLTKRLKIVPPTVKQAKETEINRVGFGYDFSSNDYKILRIVFGYPCFDSILEAELYSASGNSWKEIQVPDASRSFKPRVDSEFVHANGVLYLESDNELLAFDLHSEVFRVFSFPNPLLYTRRSPVLDYEGSVAMIFKELDGDVSVRSLWTLDNVSWTRKFNLEFDQYLWWVHLYLGVGQFLATGRNEEYIIYDHRKKQTKKLPSPIFADKLSLAMYSESLVSV